MFKHINPAPSFSPLKKQAEKRFDKTDRDNYANKSKSCHFSYGNSRKHPISNQSLTFDSRPLDELKFETVLGRSR